MPRLPGSSPMKPWLGICLAALLIIPALGGAAETGDRADPPETHGVVRAPLPGPNPRWLFTAPARKGQNGRASSLLVLTAEGKFHIPLLGGESAKKDLLWERNPIPSDLTVEVPPADLGGGRLAGPGRDGFFVIVNTQAREWRFVGPSVPLSHLSRPVGLARGAAAAVGQDGSILLFQDSENGWHETHRIAPGSADLPSAALGDALLMAADLDGDGRKELIVPAAPSGRYRHGVLGDAIEPTEIRVFRLEGDKLRLLAFFPAGGDGVFEALGALAADLDGDGREEILITRSDSASGAAHLVLALQDGKPVVKARGWPTGSGGRWSHLLGAFDVDRSGLKVLAVETPHLAGSLLALRMLPGELRVRARRSGFTTHTIGSRNLWQFALLRRGGLTEVVLQERSRNRLAALALVGNRWLLRWTLPLPSPVLSNIVSGDFDGDGREDLALADAGGRLLLLLSSRR
ncbi:MAG: VCBS repeat-containing protein [Candidatus Tectomicrobia bacterium]|nr:VCBS repeat-containing protein [Candidatus Tectomicrobia bacterium]